MFQVFNDMIETVIELAIVFDYLSENYDLMQRSIDKATIVLDSFEW